MDLYFDTTFGLNPAEKDAVNGKSQHGEVIKQGLKDQLTKNGLGAATVCSQIYLVSAPGMLAARGVNFDGMKYIWDEFDLLRSIVECVAQRRY